ncbi:glycoside hydrolase family 88/105 protein [Galbibacter sp.]|uniref:glycoside hydrolase family 88/105 protein n=1 Tax=Galbibacter sp. TaxID=2918471 RepID=UPI003A93D4EC
MKITYSVITTAFVVMSLLSSCKQKENKTEVTENTESTTIIDSTDKWSVRMANSIMHRNEDAYQIDHRTKPKWDYVHGVVLLSFEKLYDKTKDQKYYDYIKGYADTLINDQGKIATYDIEKYNIDMINAGKLLFRLFDNTTDPRYKVAMDSLRLQLFDQPRTKSGGFWHKERYPNQMWLDGLYMGAPFYTQYTVTYEQGKALDDIAHQFDLIQKHAKDEKTGLLYHGWDESKAMDWANDKTGTSPNFWSRSLGWYAMAIVDVLDYFPEDHPARPRLITYLNELATAVIKVQDETGLWYQVTDMGNREGNYLEASGSSMLTYTLAKGVNKGYLPAHFMKNAELGFKGLTEKLIKVDKEGLLTITQACAVAGLGGKPYRDGSYEYYINERKKDNDPKATGPFILAALALNK